jgi:hypothetical protein
MTPAQYVMIGLMTFMFIVTSGSGQVDWTKMPNPFSKEYQYMMFAAIFVAVFMWPLVWVAYLFKKAE